MWRRKRRSFEDFREEIESHLAIEADALREAGSKTAARQAFGNVGAAQERWYEHGRWMVFDHLKRDGWQALRQLKKRPGFSALVILTLALGIGANSAIFSVVDAVLLRPLPYKDAGRLAMLFSGDPAQELHEGRVSLPNFEDWKQRNRSFEYMTAFVGQTFLLATGGSPERMRTARVGADFWPLLGVAPVLGRVFTPEEERRGERVAVLSYAVWQQEFGGSADVLGSRLGMDDRSYRVIGVMPPDFHFPFPDSKVWEPMTAHPYWARNRTGPRSDPLWGVAARLKTGVTWSGAQTEMNAIARRLRTEYPGPGMPALIPVVPLDRQLTGKFRLSLWLLLGSVFLMLLIASINVAGLLLARGSVRAREFAVRRALGAGTARIAGQVLTETLVLSACGGLLGLLLAVSGAEAVKAFGPAEIPRLAEVRVDWVVLLFTAGITAFTALLASVWPAMAAGRMRIASRQWTSVSTRRTADFLVVGEFALALVLLISATLLIRSFLLLHAVDPGFRPDHMLAMRVDLHLGRTDDQQAAYFEEAIRRVDSIPGVHSAAAVTGFLRSDPEDSVQIEGRPLQEPGPCLDLTAGPFLETAGIPLKSGRIFSDRDSRGALPVAIVNEAMARLYWPGSDAIGKRFRFRVSEPWITVVGVAGDMRRQGMDRPAAPQVFRPRRQGLENMMDIIARTNLPPAAMASMVRDEIQAVDKSVAKFRVGIVSQEMVEAAGERRFDTFLVSSFAIAALLLSAIGIYGLLHHSVVQRTNEIGVRVALGAQPGAVMSMVLRQGLRLAAAGAALGLAGAFLVARLLSALLYGIAPTDPLTFGIAVLLLIAVAGLACYVPSRRAARIDPILALRQD
ncbi:MAG TPA: ABC transporter permease [Candidatus Sulfopaludibacter sp.]|jgi:putative ABC transport system permease protein|nr:ABC transporter permease [Candidatus Sulfopaludibacter sp.]